MKKIGFSVMKIIVCVAFIFATIFISCNTSDVKYGSMNNKEVGEYDSSSEGTYTFNGLKCEYYLYNKTIGHVHMIYFHKPDCKFCKERYEKMFMDILNKKIGEKNDSLPYSKFPMESKKIKK